jgi:hypothetical protein
MTWISYYRGGSTDSKGKPILCVDDNSLYVNLKEAEGYARAYANHHLEEGQGIAGKALQSNIHIKHDMTVLDRSDCPYWNLWWVGLHAAFAIRLTSTHACNDDYILEFLLPRDMKGTSEQKLLIDKVLRTLQKKCLKLWIVRGRELNETNNFEVRSDGVRMSNIPHEAVSRISPFPISNGVLEGNEFMPLGILKPTSNQAEETHDPLEQVLFFTVCHCFLDE